MGFKDLKKLGRTENRLFLVLVLWLLIAYSLFSFKLPGIFELDPLWGIVLFTPLLGLCLVLGLTAIFTHKEIRKVTPKWLLIYCVIGFLIILLFTVLTLILAVLGIFLFIFITALFTLWSCYENGVSWDEKIYKWPSPLNHIARWLQFIILPLLAGFIILFAALAGTIWAVISPEIAYLYAIVGWGIVLVCGFLWGLAFFFILFGKLNSWIGVFFIWVGIYTWYLMFKAFLSLSLESGTSTSSIGGNLMILIQVGLYFFDLLLVLSVIGNLIGTRSEKLSKKLHMKSETLFIGLIFGKAAFEFVDILPGTDVGTLKAILTFVLFFPLVFITGLFGLFNYFKIKKGMKRAKKEKEKAKKIKKHGIQCKECGASNKGEAKFCKKCGKELSS